jgi:hypothetical protein
MSCPAKVVPLFVCLCYLIGGIASRAQDRLKMMPGYDHSKRMLQLRTNVVLGALKITWRDGGKALEYKKEGKLYRFDIALHHLSELPATNSSNKEANQIKSAWPPPDVPQRRTSIHRISPDGKHKVYYKEPTFPHQCGLHQRLGRYY